MRTVVHHHFENPIKKDRERSRDIRPQNDRSDRVESCNDLPRWVPEVVGVDPDHRYLRSTYRDPLKIACGGTLVRKLENISTQESEIVLGIGLDITRHEH